MTMKPPAPTTDETHDPARRSWAPSANSGDIDFAIPNLPLGIFSVVDGKPRFGVAIGDAIPDIGVMLHAGCRLSPRRDVAAAKLFFRKALKTQGRPPRVITLDGYAASHRAVRELPEENGIWKDTKLRSSKYLNNIIEQDHRGVKARIGPMPGFKRFRQAKVTIA